jgi:hypothetical protein
VLAGLQAAMLIGDAATDRIGPIDNQPGSRTDSAKHRRQRGPLAKQGSIHISAVRPAQPLLESVEDQFQSVVEFVGVGIVFAHNLLGEHLRQIRVSLGH